jgi:HlyD family secretion protein
MGKGMKRKHWTVLGATLLLLAGVLFLAFRPAPSRVEAAAVKTATFERVVEEDGRTRVRERYVVSAPLAGRLARIQLKAGDDVRAGAPVAVLWPSAPAMIDTRTHGELSERIGAAAAAVEQARANVAREEAALAKAEIDLARQKKLQGEGFVSPSVLDQTELAVRVQSKALEAARFAGEGARHDLAQARAALLRAQEGAAIRRPGSAWQITSPVDGRVLRVLQENEAAVAVGAPLLEVANAGDLEIVVDVLSADATRIPAGAPVRIEAGPGLLLQGRVRRVEPSAFTKVSALGVEEQRVNVIIDFDSASAQGRGIGDGYRVDVRIVTFARDDAIVLPVASLFRREDGWAVFVIEGGRAHLREVRLAGRNDRDAWIEAGASPGEQVIVYPGDTVRDGARVRVVRGT